MKIGVIVSRFQTDDLTNGHKSLIDYVNDQSDVLVILLGVARARGSLSNPLNYETRKKMILGSYPKALIFPVYDNKSDKVWSSKLDETLIQFESEYNVIILHHSRDSFATRYHGKHLTHEFIPIFEVNATSRRNEIYEQGAIDNPLFRQAIIYNSHDRYPICFPAVDIFVFDKRTNKVLLGLREGMQEWRLPGGFVDISDSSYKISAVRELKEETGLIVQVKDLVCLDSFKINDWGYPETGKDRIFSTLFWVAIDTDQQAIANDDLSGLEWFDIDVVGGAFSDKPLVITEEHHPLIKEAIIYYRSSIYAEK